MKIHIQANYPLIYLLTSEEERALQKIDEVAKELKRKFFVWSETKGLKNYVLEKAEDEKLSDPQNLLEHIRNFDGNGIFVLLDFHEFLNDRTIKRQLKEVSQTLKKSHKTIVLLSPTMNLPIEISKEIVVLDLELPTVLEISETLEKILETLRKQNIISELSPNIREKIVKAGQGLTLNEFRNAIAKSIVTSKELSFKTITDIIDEKKQLIRKTGILEYFSPNDTFSQIGGLKSLKDWLNVRGLAFSDRATAFGIPAPKGLLLVGVQGCGKSLTAKAIASHWKLPLLRLDVGKIFHGFIGSSEANVREVIQLAEATAPCVLWIDEIEKGISGTASSGMTDGGTTSRVISSLTTWLQEKTKPVFVVATANRIELLPPEILRKGRFDEIFFVDLPDFEERKAIFKIHLEKRNRHPKNFDLEFLSKETGGFSGAEIEQAVISGLFEAFREERILETKDVQKAISETVPLSKMMQEQIDYLRNWSVLRARKSS
ncbi:AAA family ATPase [bacterium]|nr:AAA family ATPase [bacterium]